MFLKLFGDLHTCYRCLPMKAVLLVWLGLWASTSSWSGWQGGMTGSQSCNRGSMFLSMYQIMMLRGGRGAGELWDLWCWFNIKTETHCSREPTGASLKDSKGGCLPRVHDQLESLPPSRCGVLWVNGVWRRKGAVKGANLSLKWTFYRNPIFSGAQSQTDLVD